MVAARRTLGPIEVAADWWRFMTKFLRQGTAIGGVGPSSRWIAHAAVNGIDFARARCIVELGAGTGAITAALLSRASSHCRTLILEREPEFCALLRQRFPHTEIVQADALALDRVMDKGGMEQIDHVISGLPLPSFAAADRDALIQIVHRRLAPHGTFRQLTNMPWVYQKLYRSYFDDVKFKLVALNLPPGGIYICRGWPAKRSA